MSSVFGRMAKGILTVLGEDALLRNAVPCKINIEHGVQLTGMDGESASYRGDLVVARDVATIEKQHDPKSGDRFRFEPDSGPHAGTTWRLEGLVEDNGYTRRYVVMRES